MKFNSSANGLCVAAMALIGAAGHGFAEPPKPDGGKFTLAIKGKTIGTDTFRLLPDGCDSDVHVSAGPGQEVQFHQTLKYKKGQWSEVTTDAGPLGAMSLTLAGDKSTVKVGGKPTIVQKLPAVVYPFGNSSPHLLAYVIAAYDTKKGGAQKFDLILSEGVGPKGVVLLSATINEPETSARQISGKQVSVSHYLFTINGGAAPLAMEVLTDKDRHVLLWSVPLQRYTGVRDGFQELAK